MLIQRTLTPAGSAAGSAAGSLAGSAAEAAAGSVTDCAAVGRTASADVNFSKECCAGVIGVSNKV